MRATSRHQLQLFAAFVVAACLATVLFSAQPVDAATRQVGNELVGEGGQFGVAGLHQLGASVAMNDAGTRIVVGAMGASDGANDGPIFVGRVRVLDLVDGTWQDVGRSLYGSERLQGLGAGVAMDATGDRIAVSSNAQRDVGAVHIFDLVDGDWVQVGATISGPESDDLFGRYLALTPDGSRLVISAPWSGVGELRSGFVQAYDLVGDNWVKVGNQLTGSDEDRLGTSFAVSSDGSRLIVGAWGDNSVQTHGGRAQVFDLVDGTWVQVGEPIVGTNLEEHVGRTVEITRDGSRIFVASFGEAGIEDEFGAIRAFDLVDGSWVQVGATLEGEERFELIGTGLRVSADGNRIVAVTSGLNQDFSGGVKVFDLVDSEWVEAVGNRIAAAQRFSSDLGLSADGSRVLVGEPRTSSNGLWSGRARVFDLDIAAPACGGQPATIVGTPGDDVIRGSNDSDVIVALQGNDEIYGLGDDDIICAGKGDDVVYGGRGFDVIFGAQGDDTIYSADGDSEEDRDDRRGARMFGGAGNDTIHGSDRWDRMQGGPGRDRLIGYEGRDWIRGGGGPDSISGGPNIDDVHGGNENDSIVIEGNDSVRGGAGARDVCSLVAGAQPDPFISCEILR